MKILRHTAESANDRARSDDLLNDVSRRQRDEAFTCGMDPDRAGAERAQQRRQRTEASDRARMEKARLMEGDTNPRTQMWFDIEKSAGRAVRTESRKFAQGQRAYRRATR